MIWSMSPLAAATDYSSYHYLVKKILSMRGLDGRMKTSLSQLIFVEKILSLATIH